LTRWVVKLRRLATLTAEEHRLLAAAWWTLWRVELGLRVAPQRLAARRHRPSASTGDPGARRRARTLERWVGVAARHHPLRPRCLGRSLCLQTLLAREGIDSELKIGVRRTASGVQAHAWLERGGAALAEAAEAGREFLPLEPAG
jgi:hypothetical protein